jgi:hypothetical protein
MDYVAARFQSDAGSKRSLRSAICDAEIPPPSLWHFSWYAMMAPLRYAWLFVFSLGMPADAAQKLSEHDVINYLAQSVCLDELRRPTAGTPLDANCRSKRPQAAADRVFYRKHDWPNADDLGRATTGYQASDSVITERGGRAWIIQTFDFGDAPRTFGKFDSQGDGGQVLVFINGWASAIMTEDAGAGVQWFIDPGCRAAPKSDAGLVSWVFFGDDVQPTAWQSVIALLNRETAPTGCPTHFNTAYTRYRADQIDMSFRMVSRTGSVQSIIRNLDVVLSEHYAGPDVAHADHLELSGTFQHVHYAADDRRSSARSTRRTSVGSRGSIRFHCSSLSQNRFLRTILIPFQKRVRIVLSDPKNL